MSGDRFTVALQPGSVEVADRTFGVWTAGDGPPVVLLHGFSDDGSCWVGTAGIFTRKGHRVIAPDARAHGRTPLHPDDGFTAGERARDAVAVLDALGIAESLLVGHSMGALTAMQVAAEHPRLAHAVVLVDPPLAGRDTDAHTDRENPFEAWVTQVAAMAVGDLADQCRRDSPAWTDEEVDAWVASKRKVDLGLFSRSQSWHEGSWRATLGSLAVPGLLVAGEVDRGSAVDSAAASWIEDNTSVEFERLVGAGHSAHRDAREGFADLVDAFLARLHAS